MIKLQTEIKNFKMLELISTYVKIHEMCIFVKPSVIASVIAKVTWCAMLFLSESALSEEYAYRIGLLCVLHIICYRQLMNATTKRTVTVIYSTQRLLSFQCSP